jgi:outer membrane protein TolC
MKALRVVLCLFLFLGSAILSRAQVPDDGSDKLSAVATLLPQHHHSDVSGPIFDLEQIEKMALAANPEIRVAVRKVAVAEAHVPSAGALDDPSLMYRGWQVPLHQPWNYNAAQNMFMIGQALPWPGKRGLRTNVAEAEVAEAKAALDVTKLDVRIRARKAFYDLLRAEDGLRIHDQHVDIAHQGVEAAKIKYAVGKVPQQDILKAQVSLTRLAEHLIHFEQDADLARARLNTLLGRDPSAPVDVRGEHVTSPRLPSIETLEKTALQSRPDLLQMQVAADKSRKEETLAKTAYKPDFTVAAGYMLMPRGSEFRNNYMVEGSLNLPWLNRRKHDAEIAESSAKVTEQDAEFEAMRNAAFGQIQEALVEARAAQKLAIVYQQSLRPQAEATLHSTVIAYENNRTEFLDLLDSQMTSH